MQFEPVTMGGYKLLHEGVKALSTVEANGIAIDEDYLAAEMISLGNRISIGENKLKSHSIWTQWKRRYGGKTNLGSTEQLGYILFNEMGHKVHNHTESGLPQCDEAALEKVNIGFTRNYLKLAKLKKALATYLKGIQRELVNGRIHPVFNLHNVKTFRGSSDSPNFQNMPIRNPMMSKIIRRCFIPSTGHDLLEVDYSGAEVKVACCYHNDPTMFQYLTDPNTDMHGDTAMEMFFLEKQYLDKKTHRHAAKNLFVFPQFYGDYYIQCAKNLWEAIDRFKMPGVGDWSLKEWLDHKGISRLGKCDPKKKPKKGTFEFHIKSVEDSFWNDRFPVYTKWKKEFYEEYLKNGYFDTLTGFRIHGNMNRKEVCNWPVQGSSFHCLLWSLIELNKQLKKYKMKTKIVGQIHDSIITDTHRKERNNVLEMHQQIMTVDVAKAYPWLTVPMEIEADITPEGGSWYNKHEIKI